MVGLPPGAHWRPIYQLTYNGKDVTKDLVGRVKDLTLRDQRGFEADQLDTVRSYQARAMRTLALACRKTGSLTTEHMTYLGLTPEQIAGAIPLETTADSAIHSYMIPSQLLPILEPLLFTPVIGKPLYDLLVSQGLPR